MQSGLSLKDLGFTKPLSWREHKEITKQALIKQSTPELMEKVKNS
jgi:hypothetical protein